MVDVHGDIERPGEIVRSAERKDAKHSRCPNDGVGDRTDGPVTAGRYDHRRGRLALQQPWHEGDVLNRDLGGDPPAHRVDRLPRLIELAAAARTRAADSARL